MNFTTLLSRSSSSLLHYLSKLPSDVNSSLLFALSANASNLEAITSRLRLLAPHTVGCLSSSPAEDPGLLICSMARFSSSECVPFRSELPGRAPVQVGRWNRKIHVKEELPDLTLLSENRRIIWENTGEVPRVPLELRNQRDINALIYFSDDAPEGFLRSLSAVPQAAKLGLIASSTPFITGRPFSLFYNEHIYSSGAVGLALKHHPRPTPITSFHGLIPLSRPVTVSKSEGNMILELNHSNPSKLLVEAITTGTPLQSASKDEQFYLGHFYSEPSINHQLRRVYRILSGDPSRGSIALDAESAPEENERVQFFYRPPSNHQGALESLDTQTKNDPSIQFSCSPHEDVPAPSDLSDQEGIVHVVRDSFIAASENGFCCAESTSSAPTWKCTVPGATGSLKWVDK